MVERVIANIEGNSGVVTYKSDLAHRLDELKKAAKANLCSDQSHRISEIAGFIKVLKEERHRIAHGLWGLSADGNFISIFPRDATGHVGKPMDANDMREIKRLIWQAHQALSPFADLGQSVELSLRRTPSTQVSPRPVLPLIGQPRKTRLRTSQKHG